MGGKPVEPKALGDYAKALKADTLKSQADVLDLAARLELGATNAYIGVIPSLKNPALAQAARGRLRIHFFCCPRPRSRPRTMACARFSTPILSDAMRVPSKLLQNRISCFIFD